MFPGAKSVMVAVATSYDIPAKLIMPPILNMKASTSMLGLGDIVIPGLYLGFMDKFDQQ